MTVTVDSSNLIASLTKAAILLATEMKNKTNNGQYPHELPDTITVDPAKEVGNGKYEVRINISHPAAAAFEFGSGIHATKGSPKPYLIQPRNAPVLAFPWQPEFVPWGSKKFAWVYLDDPQGTKGKYLFHYVEHPGIEARPYVRPSIAAKKAEITKIIGKAFRISISGQSNKIEEI